MTDQQQANIQAEANQPAPMPSAEQQADQGRSPEAPAQIEESAQQTDNQDLKLPEDAKQRTSEQFNKLKRQLAEEKEQRLRLERSMQYNQTPSVSQFNTSPDYYDPDSGVVDVYKLDARLKQAEQRAQTAERQAMAIQQAEDRKQERVAFKAHPELDPNSDKFDEEFHNATIGYLATAYSKGQQPSLKQVADRLKGFNKTQIEEAQKEAVERLTPKEQASLQATGRSDRRRYAQDDMQTLKLRSRQGDLDAIVARLRNAK